VSKSIREVRQKEWCETFLKEERGILYICPRAGKTRVAINIMMNLKNPKVLISYPNLSIEASWKEEFKIMKYNSKNVTFCTHLALNKYVKNDFDLIIIDEIHLLSENQIKSFKSFINYRVLGLTGTMSNWTEMTITRELNLSVISRYSIEQAIEEGIITDYRIIVNTVPLDNTVKILYGKKWRTEKQQFDAISYVIPKVKDPKFLRISRMRIIQKSIAKVNLTKKLLKQYSNDRVLIFCGLIDIAEKIGCPVYHSKSTDKNILDDFASGNGNQLAVVKLGNTGTTYKPLQKVVIIILTVIVKI
jgi:superfamily II DNA or RNA helicase